MKIHKIRSRFSGFRELFVCHFNMRNIHELSEKPFILLSENLPETIAPERALQKLRSHEVTSCNLAFCIKTLAATHSAVKNTKK